MPKLSVVNPYLREPELRERAVVKSVATSSAIEGICAPFRAATQKNGKRSAAVARANGRKSGIKRA